MRILPIKMFASPAFCLAVNHLLDQAAWARQRLAMFGGRSVELEAAGLTLRLSITSSGHFQPGTGASGAIATPDTAISVSVVQLGALVGQDSTATGGAVHVRGDAELAEALGYVFRHLRWDVEEDLSRFVGDIAAHRIVTGATDFQYQARRSTRHLAEGATEYLTEEARLLTARPAFEQLAAELQALRDQLARLEKRTNRLRSRKPRASRGQ